MKNKVLIIDDEFIICEVAKDMFEILGFEAFTAETRNEAIECFKENHENIAIVILDLHIPGTSGIEILKDLFMISKDFISILASGMYMIEDIPKYKEIGFTDVIDKPYGFESIKELIKKWINT